MNNTFSGANLNNIKELNISAVLKTIYEKKGVSRTDIATYTDMSCAFVTKVLSKLISADIVLESKNAASDRGRPKVSIEFNYKKYAMVGLRLNVRYVSAALCLSNGDMVCHYSRDIESGDTGEKVFRKCLDVLTLAMSNADGLTVLGIGIAAPGPLPVELDRVTAMPKSFAADFSNIPIVELIEKEFGLSVVLLHDALSGALNEYVFSDDEKYRNIVFITTDNGVGAGIITDGKPYNGSGGMAGEVSHMVIGTEDGGFTRIDSYLAYKNLKEECGCDSIEELFLKVKNGNEVCEKYIERYIRYMSVIITNCVTVLSPEAVVIGDKIAMIPDIVQKVCNKALTQMLPELYRDSFELIVRPYSKHSVLRGACGAVLHRALEEPCKFFLK